MCKHLKLATHLMNVQNVISIAFNQVERKIQFKLKMYYYAQIRRCSGGKYYGINILQKYLALRY